MLHLLFRLLRFALFVFFFHRHNFLLFLAFLVLLFLEFCLLMLIFLCNFLCLEVLIGVHLLFFLVPWLLAFAASCQVLLVLAVRLMCSLASSLFLLLLLF